MSTIVGTRSPLFYRSAPGGLPAILDTSQFTGNLFFVDSAAAGASDTAGHGTEPDKPFATIDFAVGQCTANQGDVILVLPGHAESINTAGGINLDVAGISVVGLGHGEDRPTITVGTSLDTSTVVVGAADVKLANVVLQPGNDGVDVLLDINADGALIEDCELRSDEANAYQADVYIDINGGANGADRVTIRRCKISSISVGANAGIEIGAVEDALVVEDCWIDGDWADAGIHSASVFTSALIRRNAVSNRQAGDHAIELTAACTGMLVDNRLYGSVLGTILDPGSLKCLGNLETDAIDQAGVDSPRTSAGGFPDDSITAAAIANAAIDAATFAAGAIDAAAIANGAIDAATFAAGAIDAAAIAADAVAEIADGVTDEAVSGHVTAGTVGAMLQPLHSGTATAGAAGTITLGASAVATNDYYNGAVIQIISGTGVGQSRMISGYTGATLVAAVTPVWATAPDNTSVYVIHPIGPVRIEAVTAGAIDAAAIANGAIDAATFAAGAIDAAAIANGAIDAATFAAGAIDAAAIANGAIDAATFAAGAIDAAAIAAGAIDAATFAAGAVDATALGADAITNAKIADNAFAAEQFALSAGEKTTDGIIVTRATAALPQSNSVDIFTVTGLCLLKRIVGYVTVQIGAVANATKLKVNSTGAGATTDICATLDINGHAVDSRYEIDAVAGFAGPLIRTLDLPLVRQQTVDLVIPPGSIMVDCAGSDGGGGRVRWSVTYVPMETGAQIVAA